MITDLFEHKNKIRDRNKQESNLRISKIFIVLHHLWNGDATTVAVKRVFACYGIRISDTLPGTHLLFGVSLLLPFGEPFPCLSFCFSHERAREGGR